MLLTEARQYLRLLQHMAPSSFEFYICMRVFSEFMPLPAQYSKAYSFVEMFSRNFLDSITARGSSKAVDLLQL